MPSINSRIVRAIWALATSALVLACSSTASQAAIIWRGDFETGNFRQWHEPGNTLRPFYWGIPNYGRPPRMTGDDPTLDSAYFGTSELVSLVTSPVRNGKYAVKFVVKNSVNGSEPADCDDNGTNCTRRRTTLGAQSLIPRDYNGLPYLGERWISFSVYVPADWDTTQTGWGPAIFSIKPRNEPATGLSGPVTFAIHGGWEITHQWSGIENPSADQIPWQQSMFYTGNYDGKPYPRSDFWPEGLKDYPDVAASQAALQSLALGAWTDWVIHLRPDARGSDSGGTGFFTVWKREGAGPWVKVLHVVPKQTTRGGMTFNHGIFYNSPPKDPADPRTGGFGIKAQLYMEKSQVWSSPRNRVLYFDNIKIGDEKTLFAEMSPDGSSPGGDAAKPLPPAAVVVQ